MNNQIQTQASKVWQTVSDPATTEAYKQAGVLTWTIFRETGYLVWLVICLVLVVGEWFWTFSFETGQTVRSWINSLEASEDAGIDRLLSKTGKSLLSVGRSSVTVALSTAKDQLGIQVSKPTLAIAPSETAPPPPVLMPETIMPPASAKLESPPTPPPLTPPIE
ncbi:hypothetical protein H6F43_13580 [Leptolyngbya sp. FACHB-36]|uniref:hypothetical protein n=1 Tax=Leptolyngbya sp. FACHB-36 TaxID=2692808 RepID=UPI00168191A1|nr:hypothetical protein [Leptolyngbya sp. FACHB-36]MBD2021208.1 hypothetical protein [Leptolyngbya sp. FACHB-36]